MIIPVKSLLFASFATIVCSLNAYLTSTILSHATIRAGKIALQNKQGQTTMVLDGDTQQMTIFDPSGKVACVRLGKNSHSYELSLRTAKTRAGGLCLHSDGDGAFLILGSDGKEVDSLFGKPPRLKTPFWVVSVDSKGKLLTYGYVDPNHSANSFGEHIKPNQLPRQPLVKH